MSELIMLGGLFLLYGLLELVMGLFGPRWMWCFVCGTKSVRGLVFWHCHNAAHQHNIENRYGKDAWRE